MSRARSRRAKSRAAYLMAPAQLIDELFGARQLTRDERVALRGDAWSLNIRARYGELEGASTLETLRLLVRFDHGGHEAAVEEVERQRWARLRVGYGRSS
jgi:hypothetical protein